MISTRRREQDVTELMQKKKKKKKFVSPPRFGARQSSRRSPLCLNLAISTGRYLFATVSPGGEPQPRGHGGLDGALRRSRHTGPAGGAGAPSRHAGCARHRTHGPGPLDRHRHRAAGLPHIACAAAARGCRPPPLRRSRAATRPGPRVPRPVFAATRPNGSDRGRTRQLGRARRARSVDCRSRTPRPGTTGTIGSAGHGPRRQPRLMRAGAAERISAALAAASPGEVGA